ncbi:hypothetical protein HDU96_001632 [Phlyctochytrium bullatum]|nr:hypothetical protein HDU96_001632 [Phlyctochytrium bullatum]
MVRSEGFAAVGNALFIRPKGGNSTDEYGRHRDHGRGREDGRGEGNLWDRLREEHRFSRFVELIEKEKGLRDEFERSDRLTVFAPTNHAIEKFEEEFRDHDPRDGRTRRHRRHDDLDMEELILYHLVPDHQLGHRDLQDGVLLKTSLETRGLDGAHQRIRVSRAFGEVYLNMYARVHHQGEYEADNGVIWALENVLVPPGNAMDVLYHVPFAFSTSVSALCRLDATEKIEKMKGATLFMPDNDAWESLGLRNLYYLFGDEGHEDLKKIMKYHGAKELVYTTKMMKEETLELDSTLKGQKLTIEARCRHGHGGHRREYTECSRRGRNGRRHGRDKDDDEDGEGGFESPRDYLFVINEGEARIRFTDALGENAVIHVISEVLIPEDVVLPHDRSDAMVAKMEI